MFKVYFGPPGAGEPRGLEKQKWPSKEFVDLPEALLWAHGAARKGTVVLRIEGAASALSRSDVAACLNALGDRGNSSRGG
jgi:hypothetical protein